MKAKEIRDLIDFISNSGLDEVNIETQEFKIAVKKNSPIINTITETPITVAAPQQITEVPQVQVQQPVASTSAAPASDETSDYIEIKSPMIGTFFLLQTQILYHS